jgi:glycerol-3-phosphate dehydrogenase (NAD(P)+)
MIERIGIVGGGSWGTALALVAARAGRSVTLYAREAETVADINTRRENRQRLPGIRLDAAIAATGEIEKPFDADAVILAVPAQALRSVVAAVPRAVSAGKPLIIAAKGLERGTGKRMSEILAEEAPDAIPAILSGPSFASDVARRLPTAVTIAAEEETLALALSRALAHDAFRPYAETDIAGVELGGAIKNVLAIAAGIVAGRKLGASALAALIARSFAELRRFAEALGARPETPMGLSGLGDLVLTCSGPQSRNFAFGLALGQGVALDAPHPLVEGIETAAVARDLARREAIDMPIVEAVADIVSGKIGIDGAIERLMSRPIRRETD